MSTTEVVRSTSSALERLPEDSNAAEWTPPQRALMQQLGLINRSNWKGPLPDAPAGVVEAFLMQCRRNRLDPAARQIYAAEMGGKWTVLISIDGFRLIADRSGLYQGKKPTLWCGADGVWTDVWLSDQPPAAAKIAVMRDGFSEPLVAVATYAGYCPRDNKSGELKPSGQWKNNASNQLAKVAEMLALRQAFPNELSGLYGTEEMDQARVPQSSGRAERSAAPAVDAPAQVAIVTPKVSRDWGAEAQSIDSLAALTALAEEAQAAGEIGLVIGLAGDNDDGSAHTVMDVLRMRKAELEQPVQEPLVDVPASVPKKRQWVREARGLKTRAEVVALMQEAIAAGAPAHLVEELEAIANTLPDQDASTVDAPGWAAEQGAEGESEWVEDPATGEWVEQEPAGVLDESIGSDS
ncbi:MAG: recombinase RecT [Homoserinimonas sp.]